MMGDGKIAELRMHAKSDNNVLLRIPFMLALAVYMLFLIVIVGYVVQSNSFVAGALLMIALGFVYAAYVVALALAAAKSGVRRGTVKIFKKFGKQFTVMPGGGTWLLYMNPFLSGIVGNIEGGSDSEGEYVFVKAMYFFKVKLYVTEKEFKQAIAQAES